MKKAYPFFIAAALIFIIIWQIFFADASYYLISVIVLIIAMLPLLFSFESERHTARDLCLTAGIIALAVVSRSIFYLTPQIKPIAAVVAIGAACLGAKRGFVIGAFSMFISNFIFGQGVWTPFQMMGMGLVGLLFGIVFKNRKKSRVSLAVTGFFGVIILYGITVDAASVLFFNTEFNIKGILAVYAAGAPYTLIFAVVTAVCLFIFGESFAKKIDRVTVKYGICSD